MPFLFALGIHEFLDEVSRSPLPGEDPCAFLDEYDPAKVFSSIDQNGRYAYNQQPGIGLWNLISHISYHYQHNLRCQTLGHHISSYFFFMNELYMSAF